MQHNTARANIRLPISFIIFSPARTPDPSRVCRSYALNSRWPLSARLLSPGQNVVAPKCLLSPDTVFALAGAARVFQSRLGGETTVGFLPGPTTPSLSPLLRPRLGHGGVGSMHLWSEGSGECWQALWIAIVSGYRQVRMDRAALCHSPPWMSAIFKGHVFCSLRATCRLEKVSCTSLTPRLSISERFKATWCFVMIPGNQARTAFTNLRNTMRGSLSPIKLQWEVQVPCKYWQSNKRSTALH